MCAWLDGFCADDLEQPAPFCGYPVHQGNDAVFGVLDHHQWSSEDRFQLDAPIGESRVYGGLARRPLVNGRWDLYLCCQWHARDVERSEVQLPLMALKIKFSRGEDFALICQQFDSPPTAHIAIEILTGIAAP